MGEYLVFFHQEFFMAADCLVIFAIVYTMREKNKVILIWLGFKKKVPSKTFGGVLPINKLVRSRPGCMLMNNH